MIIEIGRLTRDPELRYTADGKAVCNFTIAIDKRGGGTTWMKVSAWGKTAENVNTYLTKGRQVQVIGTLNSDDSGNPRTYQRNDGTTAASFEMTASEVTFLSGGKHETTDEKGEYSTPDELGDWAF